MSFYFFFGSYRSGTEGKKKKKVMSALGGFELMDPGLRSILESIESRMTEGIPEGIPEVGGELRLYALYVQYIP